MELHKKMPFHCRVLVVLDPSFQGILKFGVNGFLSMKKEGRNLSLGVKIQRTLFSSFVAKNLLLLG